MEAHPGRYRAITARNLGGQPEWERVPRSHREAIRVLSRVLPFRANRYVLQSLIDWERVPDDPIFQMVFPQPGMLDPEDYEAVREEMARGSARRLRRTVERIRLRLNPHPAGQLTHNVPSLRGRRLRGLQHKYRETVLFFPAQGQTCHAYCTYCFRWAQFVGMPEIRFEARGTRDLVAYLRAHPEVTDILITGGDPMIMKTGVLRGYVEPLLAAELEHLRSIRIGTKALAFWPQRFVTDPDAEECLRLFERVVASGRHLALMAHFSHPVELEPQLAREAVRRVRSTGAEIRMQAPLVRHVNDDPEAWAELWRQGVRLGMVPYYMFVARDTGPRGYFELPLVRCYEIYRDAFSRVSGLARTARGPSMSAHPGKVRVAGIEEIRGETVFVLEMLQARDPAWVLRPFFARFDRRAAWLDELRPAFGAERFFFEPEPAGRPSAAAVDRLHPSQLVH